MDEQVGLFGEVFVKHYDADGNLKSTSSSKNLILDRGSNYLLQRIFSKVGASVSYGTITNPTINPFESLIIGNSDDGNGSGAAYTVYANESNGDINSAGQGNGSSSARVLTVHQTAPVASFPRPAYTANNYTSQFNTQTSGGNSGILNTVKTFTYNDSLYAVVAGTWVVNTGYAGTYTSTYQLVNNKWNLIQSLQIDGASCVDVTTISGNIYLVVSSWYNATGTSWNAYTYEYIWNGTGWTLLASVQPGGGTMGCEFFSMTINGSTKYLLIDSNYHTGAGGDPAGSVLYLWNGTSHLAIGAQNLPTATKTLMNRFFMIGTDGYLLQINNGSNCLVYKQPPYSANNGAAFGYPTTSTTSNTIGTGSKTFTVASGLPYVAAQTVYVSSQANTANYMIGTVTSYATTSLVLNITSSGGSGTLTDWQITVVTPWQTITTTTASSGDSFTIGSDAYIVITTRDGKITTYKWNTPTANIFNSWQTITLTNGAIPGKVLTYSIAGNNYLAVYCEVTYVLKTYQWSASANSGNGGFVEINSYPMYGCSNLSYVSYNSENYLLWAGGLGHNSICTNTPFGLLRVSPSYNSTPAYNKTVLADDNLNYTVDLKANGDYYGNNVVANGTPFSWYCLNSANSEYMGINASSIVISSVNSSTSTFTAATPHNLTVGDTLVFTNPNNFYPTLSAGTLNNTIYYVKSTPNATDFTISTTNGGTTTTVTVGTWTSGTLTAMATSYSRKMFIDLNTTVTNISGATMSAPFIFTYIDDDFEFDISLTHLGGAANTMLGLCVRNPTSTTENNLYYVSMLGTPNTLMSGSTVNAGTTATANYTSTDTFLRLKRNGSDIVLLSKANVGDSWTTQDTISRSDFPSNLQVGIVAFNSSGDNTYIGKINTVDINTSQSTPVLVDSYNRFTNTGSSIVVNTIGFGSRHKAASGANEYPQANMQWGSRTNITPVTMNTNDYIDVVYRVKLTR